MKNGRRWFKINSIRTINGNEKEWKRNQRTSNPFTQYIILIILLLFLEDLKVKKEGKRDKHAPQEISSKKPIHRKRVVENQRKVRGKKNFMIIITIDPRFDNLSGKFNYDLFRKSYKFIENQQDEEIKEMRDTMFQQEDETDKRNIQVFLVYLF